MELKLKMSWGHAAFIWGGLLGGILGVGASVSYGIVILGAVGLAVSPLAVYILPLALAALGFLFLGAVATLLVPSSQKLDSAVSRGGVVRDIPDAGNKQQLSFTSKGSGEWDLDLGGQRYRVKMMYSRYAVWATVGGVLGVAAAVTCGWMFMGPIAGFVGIQVMASPFLMMAYSSAIVASGAAAGALLFGGLRVGLGRLCAALTGNHTVARSYSTAFNIKTYVRCESKGDFPSGAVEKVASHVSASCASSNPVSSYKLADKPCRVTGHGGGRFKIELPGR